MEASSNYGLIWVFYLTASAVFYPVLWRLTAFRNALWWSYSIRALFAAIILMPWYANTQADSFAPAVVVVLLDAITIGPEAAGRAAVPLILGLVLALAISSTMYFIKKRSKRLEKQQDSVNT